MSHGLDKEKNWERNIPYFLCKLGAMQGWFDMHKALDANEYPNSKFEFIPSAFVVDLFEEQNLTQMPRVPALAMKLELDGTKAPSYDGAAKFNLDLDNMKVPWTNKVKNDLIAKPTSDKNAPNHGEFNNAIPSMFLDMDPTVKNQYHAIVYLNAETRAKNDILPNANARATRFDNRHNTGNT